MGKLMFIGVFAVTLQGLSKNGRGSREAGGEVAPLYRRTGRVIILDRNIDRQISNTSEGRVRWIDRSDVYEQKLVDQKMSLTT